MVVGVGRLFGLTMLGVGGTVVVFVVMLGGVCVRIGIGSSALYRLAKLNVSYLYAYMKNHRYESMLFSNACRHLLIFF